MGEISFTNLTQKYAPHAGEDGDLLFDTHGGFGGLSEDELIALVDAGIDPTTAPRVRLEHTLAQGDTGCHHRIGIRKARKRFGRK